MHACEYTRVQYLLFLQVTRVTTIILHANFHALHISLKFKVSHFCSCFSVTDFFEITVQFGTPYLHAESSGEPLFKRNII